MAVASVVAPPEEGGEGMAKDERSLTRGLRNGPYFVGAGGGPHGRWLDGRLPLQGCGAEE